MGIEGFRFWLVLGRGLFFFFLEFGEYGMSIEGRVRMKSEESLYIGGFRLFFYVVLVFVKISEDLMLNMLFFVYWDWFLSLYYGLCCSKNKVIKFNNFSKF